MAAAGKITVGTVEVECPRDDCSTVVEVEVTAEVVSNHDGGDMRLVTDSNVDPVWEHYWSHVRPRGWDE